MVLCLLKKSLFGKLFLLNFIWKIQVIILGKTCLSRFKSKGEGSDLSTVNQNYPNQCLIPGTPHSNSFFLRSVWLIMNEPAIRRHAWCMMCVRSMPTAVKYSSCCYKTCSKCQCSEKNNLKLNPRVCQSINLLVRLGFGALTGTLS